MACTKKEFEHAAARLRGIDNTRERNVACEVLEDVFLRSNPKFDTKKFRKASGCWE